MDIRFLVNLIGDKVEDVMRNIVEEEKKQEGVIKLSSKEQLFLCDCLEELMEMYKEKLSWCDESDRPLLEHVVRDAQNLQNKIGAMFGGYKKYMKIEVNNNEDPQELEQK